MTTEQYPSRLLERAVSEFAKLPGIGRKTALRFALHTLSRDENSVAAMAESILRLRREVKYCRVCHNISDTDVCEICANPRRDASTICVVENVRSVMSFESTGLYHGLYHVLGGVISPMDGIGPADLRLDSLFERVAQGGIKEVILALNPTMEGDTTNFYIYRKLEQTGVTITVLARGVSVGEEVEYADEATLGRSLVGRTPFA
ncbi:MAG: recombination mediator RecR [Alloprevotella sp.]|nr:recombination mediator RecR [Bacteroidales bacterium]MDY3732937.1 recombination mediator RecR [Alloprevotella sp.]